MNETQEDIEDIRYYRTVVKDLEKTIDCKDCPWRHPDTCRECKGGKK